MKEGFYCWKQTELKLLKHSSFFRQIHQKSAMTTKVVSTEGVVFFVLVLICAGTVASNGSQQANPNKTSKKSQTSSQKVQHVYSYHNCYGSGHGRSILAFLQRLKNDINNLDGKVGLLKKELEKNNHKNHQELTQLNELLNRTTSKLDVKLSQLQNEIRQLKQKESQCSLTSGKTITNLCFNNSSSV